MRLLTPSAEKRLLDRVKKAHAKLASDALGSDLYELSYAAGALSSVDPRQSFYAPHPHVIRSMIKSGAVFIDRASVEDANERLEIAAKSIRDRLVGKVRGALRDAAASLRRQKLSGKREISKARGAAKRTAMEAIDKALAEAQRDWNLSVDVGIHDVMEDGRSQSIVKAFGPAARVFKKLQSDACRWCKALYTVDGKVPRVFTLGELAANGTNIGRKAGRPILKGENATEWRPTLGAAHLLCRCEVNVLPPGMAFNTDGQPVRAPERKGGRRTG